MPHLGLAVDFLPVRFDRDRVDTFLVLCQQAGNTDIHHQGRRGPVPWKTLLGHRSALGLTGSYFCHNYAAFMFLVWLPTYLINVHGFLWPPPGIGAMDRPLASTVLVNISGWPRMR